MARTILGATPPALDTSILSVRQKDAPLSLLSPEALENRLRQKRSFAYIEAMTKLDAGGHVHTREALDALFAAIRAELPELGIEQLPVGIVAKCYLGDPYEVHTLDCSGSILTHFKTFEALPAFMESARSLALHPEYSFIEVYVHKLVAVTRQGDAALVKGK